VQIFKGAALAKIPFISARSFSNTLVIITATTWLLLSLGGFENLGQFLIDQRNVEIVDNREISLNCGQVFTASLV
jgi:hypothetical protein